MAMPNPFWSRRTTEEFLVQESRPDDLPPVRDQDVGDGEEMVPLEEGSEASQSEGLPEVLDDEASEELLEEAGEDGAISAERQHERAISAERLGSGAISAERSKSGAISAESVRRAISAERGLQPRVGTDQEQRRFAMSSSEVVGGAESGLWPRVGADQEQKRFDMSSSEVAISARGKGKGGHYGPRGSEIQLRLPAAQQTLKATASEKKAVSEPGELERALEETMVQYLVDENAAMREEVQAMKRKMEALMKEPRQQAKVKASRRKKSAERDAALLKTPPRRETPMYTPMECRTTPGGTAVPDGPPPCEEPLKPVAFPEIPPWPFAWNVRASEALFETEGNADGVALQREQVQEGVHHQVMAVPMHGQGHRSAELDGDGSGVHGVGNGASWMESEMGALRRQLEEQARRLAWHEGQKYWQQPAGQSREGPRLTEELMHEVVRPPPPPPPVASPVEGSCGSASVDGAGSWAVVNEESCKPPGLARNEGAGVYGSLGMEKGTVGENKRELVGENLKGNATGGGSACDEKFESLDEGLRGVPITLPVLVEPSAAQASIRAGDWITEVTPLVGDVAARAASWWEKVLASAEGAYKRWLMAGPLERLQIKPEKDAEGAGSRLDRRVTGLLLQAIPSTLKTDLVASRELTTCEILFKVLKTYQPGGVTERDEVLSQLTAHSTAKTGPEAVEMLRLWKRRYLRAAELRLSLPDPLLQASALESIMKELLGKNAQSAFRVATYRMQAQLDIAPSQSAVRDFLDLLMAEADQLVGSARVSTQPKINQVKSAEKERQSAWPCRHWGTSGGCFKGADCRYAHSWEKVEDKQKRCYTCSGLNHSARECTAGERGGKGPSGEDEGNKGGNSRSGVTSGTSSSWASSSKGKDGKGKSKDGKGKGKKESPSSPGVNRVGAEASGQTAGESMQQPGGSGGAATANSSSNIGGSSNGSSTTSGGAQGSKDGQSVGVASEIATLLKSLKVDGPTPAARTLRTVPDPAIRAVVPVESERKEDQKVLLDSGATHILRRALDANEWSLAEETDVQTAVGKCRLRKKGSTLLTDYEVQAIIPLGLLASEGLKIDWSRGGCSVRHPRFGRIPVEIEQNCPYVSGRWGRRLIEDLEMKFNSRYSMIKALRNEQVEDAEVLWDWKTLKEWFPLCPDEQMERLLIEEKVNTDALPFNRHQRRRIRRAKYIAIHLFSGGEQGWWTSRMPKSVEIICIDLLKHQDMMDNNLMAYLVQVIRTQKVIAIFGGPPCRSVSVLRTRDDGGPRQLREREGPLRWAREGLSPAEYQVAFGDAQLWLRSLTLVREGKKRFSRLGGLFETPEDPALYWLEKKECPSFTTWPEIQQTMDLVGWKRISLDQGCLGHPRRKPTCLWSGWEEVLLLDGMRDGRTSKAWPSQLDDAVKESRKLASWAPALKRTVVSALHNFVGGPAVRAFSADEEKNLEAW